MPLWSPAGKGLTSWLSFVVYNRVCHFPIGALGQVWYLILSNPDLCILTYFALYTFHKLHKKQPMFDFVFKKAVSSFLKVRVKNCTLPRTSYISSHRKANRKG